MVTPVGDRIRAAAWIGVAIALVVVCAGNVASQTLVPPDDDLCAVRMGICKPPKVAIISAFPGEIVPLLARTSVTESFTHEGRNYYVGRLGNTRVVLVRGGIGLVNAEATARYLVGRFKLSAIVFSGVAGSPYDVGDVVVPDSWTDGTTTYPVDRTLLAIARSVAAANIPLEAHTPVPPCPPGPDLSLGRTPKIVVGGTGESSDPYGGHAAPCAGDDLVLGCEERPCSLPAQEGPPCGPGTSAMPAFVTPAPTTVAQDMETVAVAAVAAEAKIPFLGFRGVSDGAGDPCNLPGFPQQFFNYYQLAADNSALATIALLEERARRQHPLAPDPNVAIADPDQAVRASCQWERAASPTCAGWSAPHDVTAEVKRACAFTARANGAEPGSDLATRADRRAHQSWTQAAAILRGSSTDAKPRCRRECISALQQRAGTP
jgi:nucleoside phosphorylase